MLWLVLYTALCLALGLLIAVLATRVRYEAAIKAIIFVPMAISAVAVGLIWKFVYSPDPDIGVLNAIRTGVFGGLDALASGARTRSTTRSSSPTCGRRPASRWSCSRRR